VEVLYERYGRKRVAYAPKTWQVNEDDVWDLCYKTLYRMLEVIGRYTFTHEEKFAAMVFTIFINYMRNHYRTQMMHKNEVVRLDETHHAVAIGNEDAPVPEALQQLQQVLDGLADWERMLLLLRS
jgi:DNA-directed RNA polymerase specialized sigma24 family protein